MVDWPSYTHKTGLIDSRSESNYLRTWNSERPPDFDIFVKYFFLTVAMEIVFPLARLDIRASITGITSILILSHG